MIKNNINKDNYKVGYGEEADEDNVEKWEIGDILLNTQSGEFYRIEEIKRNQNFLNVIIADYYNLVLWDKTTKSHKGGIYRYSKESLDRFFEHDNDYLRYKKLKEIFLDGNEG